MVTTSLFSIPRGEFARIMAMRFGGVWLLGLLAGIIAAAAIAGVVADWRWGVASLMLLLVATPMGAAYLYFAHGLRRECYVNIAPHTVRFSPDCLHIDVSVAASVGAHHGAAAQEPADECYRTYSLRIPYGRTRRYTVDSKGITIRIEKPDPGFIRIPYSAFESTDDLRAAVNLLSPAN